MTVRVISKFNLLYYDSPKGRRKIESFDPGSSAYFINDELGKLVSERVDSIIIKSFNDARITYNNYLGVPQPIVKMIDIHSVFPTVRTNRALYTPIINHGFLPNFISTLEREFLSNHDFEYEKKDLGAKHTWTSDIEHFIMTRRNSIIGNLFKQPKKKNKRKASITHDGRFYLVELYFYASTRETYFPIHSIYCYKHCY